MSRHLNILLLEDNPSDAFFIQRLLERTSFTTRIEVVQTREDFERQLLDLRPDLILSDHSLPAFNSLEAFRIARKVFPGIPFILVTGSVSEEFAVQCMKAGIDDYILKNSLLRLPAAVETLLNSREMRREKEIVESLHKELRTAYEEIEAKNRDITDSLNYARRLQDALLPDRRSFQALFPDSFIFFRPKDIVSGDFYWFGSSGNKLLLAVADCTGHGVPGALMSMLGFNFLNASAKNDNNASAASVLKEVDGHFSRAFRTSAGQGFSSDGMDIALCLIDREAGTLEFAGANRPLLAVLSGELRTFQPSKRGIGGNGSSRSYDYLQHEIKFCEGDSFYLFTDGYSDQFGGDYDRKIMRRNFVSLIGSLAQLPMARQCSGIEAYFEQWKADREQTDDVLVMGFRI